MARRRRQNKGGNLSHQHLLDMGFITSIMATYRLFNKAKANIKKIEDEGMFGVGH